MTQTDILQKQLERITSIIEDNITGLTVMQYPPAVISTRLPAVLLTVSSVSYSKRAATVYDATVQWDIILYLAEATQGLQYVNQVNLYSFLDQFVNTFLSRRRLQLNGDALDYVRETDIQLISALTGLQRYPPRNGQALYWGCQYRLTTYSTNVTIQTV